MTWARWTLVLALAAFGLGLRLATLRTPFFNDDLFQLTFLAGEGTGGFSFRNDLDLFHFFDGDREAARAKMSEGSLPWRFDDTQRLAYFRPVSSASMWLDHALGLSSLAAHWLNVGCFVLFVCVAWRTYLRFLPPDAAVLAALAILLAPVSIVPTKWWVGRYATLVALFATAGILFHLRWLESGRRRERGLSLALLVLALLAGEIGIQGFAFVVAHTLVRRWGSARRIARELWPIAALLAAYMLARRPLGYVVANSALYIDPLLEPAAFLVHVARNLHTLFVGAVLNQAHEGHVPPLPPWKLLAWVGLFALVLAALVRASARKRDRATLVLVAWLSLASAATLVFCFTSRRELRPWTFLVPQLATHALLALAVTAAWRRGGVERALAGALAVVWLALPVQAHFKAIEGARGLQRTASPQALRARFPADVRAAITPDTDLIVLLRNPDQILPPDFLRPWYGIEARPDVCTLTLSDTARVPAHDLVLTRTGPASLRLSGVEPFVRANDLYRFDERSPLAAGQTVSLAHVTVRVEEVGSWHGPEARAPLQRLRSAEFTFALPLESERILLLTWNEDHFELAVPPPLGQSIQLR